MDHDSRRLLFKSAEALAEHLGDGFVGRIEINIFKGGVATVNVLESLRPESLKPLATKVTI